MDHIKKLIIEKYEQELAELETIMRIIGETHEEYQSRKKLRDELIKIIKKIKET